MNFLEFAIFLQVYVFVLKGFIFYFCVYECFVCIYVCALCMYLVLQEVIGGCQIPWSSGPHAYMTTDLSL